MTTPTPITEALEPCHFCGGVVRSDRYGPDDIAPEMAIDCEGECQGIFIFPHVKAGDWSALATAWNTRASLKSQPIDLDPNGGAQESAWFAGTEDCEGNPLVAVRLDHVRSMQARLDQVVRHDPGCDAIDGNGDEDCGCDAVPVLRDFEALFADSLPPEPACSSGEAEGDPIAEFLTPTPWPIPTDEDKAMAIEMVNLSFMPMTDEAYTMMARAIAVGRAAALSQPVSGVEG